MVSRMVWPTFSLRPWSESSGIADGLVTRRSIVSPALAPNSRANAAERPTSRARGGSPDAGRGRRRPAFALVLQRAVAPAVDLNIGGAMAARLVRDDAVERDH